MSNDDTPLPPPSTDLDSTRHLPDPSIVIDSQEQAWQRLITRVVPRDEIPSLIETVLSGRKTDVADRLRESDAQAFVDILDEARHHTLYFQVMVDLIVRSFFQALNGFDLAPHIRKKCMKILYRMCARHALFPSSLRVELCDNPDNIVLYHGGFGDVSKREYQGREVAVKRLRIYATSDLKKIIRVGFKSYSSLPT